MAVNKAVVKEEVPAKLVFPEKGQGMECGFGCVAL